MSRGDGGLTLKKGMQHDMDTCLIGKCCVIGNFNVVGFITLHEKMKINKS